jgi:hypothetical protein
LVEGDGSVVHVEERVIGSHDGVTEDNGVGKFRGNVVNTLKAGIKSSEVELELTVGKTLNVHLGSDSDGSLGINFELEFGEGSGVTTESADGLSVDTRLALSLEVVHSANNLVEEGTGKTNGVRVDIEDSAKTAELVSEGTDGDGRDGGDSPVGISSDLGDKVLVEVKVVVELHSESTLGEEDGEVGNHIEETLLVAISETETEITESTSTNLFRERSLAFSGDHGRSFLSKSPVGVVNVGLSVDEVTLGGEVRVVNRVGVLGVSFTEVELFTRVRLESETLFSEEGLGAVESNEHSGGLSGVLAEVNGGSVTGTGDESQSDLTIAGGSEHIVSGSEGALSDGEKAEDDDDALEHF